MRAMAENNLTWQELESEIFTPEEIMASRARVQIISAVIEARKEKGLSQQQLADLAGVKQPAVARLENGSVSPSVDTLSKLLIPLGKKIAIVDA